MPPPTLKQLQYSNIQAITDISGSGCVKERIDNPKTATNAALSKTQRRNKYKDWRYILDLDGHEIAKTLTDYIHNNLMIEVEHEGKKQTVNLPAPADVKNMVDEAKKYHALLNDITTEGLQGGPVVVKEEDTLVRINFNGTNENAYKGVFKENKWQDNRDHWNAYFNLQIGCPASGSKSAFSTTRSLISFTMHTKIHPDFRGALGSFHFKQKTGQRNPRDQPYERLGITKRTNANGNNLFSMSVVYQPPGLNIKAEFAPFQELVKNALEDYFSSKCNIPEVPRNAKAEAIKLIVAKAVLKAAKKEAKKAKKEAAKEAAVVNIAKENNSSTVTSIKKENTQPNGQITSKSILQVEPVISNNKAAPAPAPAPARSTAPAKAFGALFANERAAAAKATAEKKAKENATKAAEKAAANTAKAAKTAANAQKAAEEAEWQSVGKHGEVVKSTPQTKKRGQGQGKGKPRGKRRNNNKTRKNRNS
jgi:hypothetical protein